MQPPKVEPDADAPEWWRRARSFRVVPLILIIVLAAILLHASQRTSPPALTTSCTTPAIALSTRSAAQHHTVRWAATGPAGTRFQLLLGVAALTPAGPRKFTPVPDPGLSKDRTQEVSAQLTMGAHCTADNIFGIVVPPGSYTVRMFTFAGPESAPTASPAASAPLTVTK